MSEIQRKAFYDAAERKFTFATIQDVEPIIDHNKALSTVEQKSDDLRHTHSIPVNVIHQWLQEEWSKGNTTVQFGSEEFDLLVKRKLQDPDNAVFRVEGPRHRVGFGS